MSRCIPYPPPGYARKCASNESLIKLQRVNVEARSDKKERKREKKEKKREQKKAKLSADLEKKLAEGKSDGRSKHELELLDKSNLTEEHGRPCTSSESTENSAGKRNREDGPYIISKKRGSILKIRLPSRKREDPATISNDGRSRSPFMDPTRSPSVALDDRKLGKPLQSSAALTTAVAHEAFQSDKKMPPPLPPASLPSPSTSKSLDANREKMEADCIVPLMSDKLYPPSAKRMRTPTFGHGTLSSDEKKLHMPEALPSLPERIALATASHLASTSMTYDTKMQKAEAWLPLANKIEMAMISHAKTEAMPTLPGKIETATPNHAQPTLTSHDRKMQKKVAKYRDLMDTWAPPPLQIVLDEVDDQDWLFARKKKDDNSVTRPKVEGFGPSCGASAAQPRAVYLPDVGIYALPYTVPF